MITGNKQIMKRILLVLFTTIITVLPILAVILLYTEYKEYNKCKQITQEYSNSKLDNKPNLNCEKSPISINIFANNNRNKQNDELIKQFESSNINQKKVLEENIKQIQNYLISVNKPYSLALNANSTYLQTFDYNQKLINDNMETLNKTKDQLNLLKSYQDLLSADEKTQIITFINVDDYSYLDKIDQIRLLNDKINNDLLAKRNNKNSLTDLEYLAIKKLSKNFTADQFLAITDSITISDTPIWNKTILSQEADKKFFELAFKRGYKYRKDADISQLTGTSETDINTVAKQQLDKMIEAGKKDGVNFKLVSGYRNPDLQKVIFTSRLDQTCKKFLLRTCTIEDIISSKANMAIDEVLQTSSVPSTSKHHTGITVDLNQIGTATLQEFKNTASYGWLSADNYFNAKRFGFLPSYPQGGTNMGPDPEPWEYIYTGTDKIK
jgi:LAS superfamily LD-carboxypeptidase LdcB